MLEYSTMTGSAPTAQNAKDKAHLSTTLAQLRGDVVATKAAEARRQVAAKKRDADLGPLLEAAEAAGGKATKEARVHAATGATGATGVAGGATGATGATGAAEQAVSNDAMAIARAAIATQKELDRAVAARESERNIAAMQLDRVRLQMADYVRCVFAAWRLYASWRFRFKLRAFNSN